MAKRRWIGALMFVVGGVVAFDNMGAMDAVAGPWFVIPALVAVVGVYLLAWPTT